MRWFLALLVIAGALGAAGCGGPTWQPAPGAPDSPPGDPSAAEDEKFFDASDAASRSPEGEKRIGAVRLRGTPDVPAELARRVTRYVNTRSAGVSDISPDGQQLLVTTRFGQTAQAHVVRSPLGARHQLTFAKEPLRNARFVPGDPGDLTFLRDIGGNEQYQLWRQDEAGQIVLLTDGKSRHGSPTWSHDGKRIAFTSNARNGKDMDIYLSDGRSASSVERLLERKGAWWVADWSHDDTQLLIGEYVSINASRIFRVDVATKRVSAVVPATPTASYREAIFAKDGQRAYIATDREGEFVELYEVPLDKATDPASWKPLTRGLAHDVEGFALSHDGRTLAFTVNVDGYSTLHLLDTTTRKHKPAANLPKGIVTGLRFAAKAPVLSFTMLGATRTGDAYTYDVQKRRPTRWTESEMGGLNPARFVEPELIRYETFDGRMIPAFVYRPKTKGPHPVMVKIHGGPEGQARPYFSALTQYLVTESNVAVVVPNVRGSNGYGKSYLLLDNGFKREDSVKDIGALLDWIASEDSLDEKRVAVFGGSYGGYMVLASLVHFGKRLVAGIDYVGISNFVTFLKNTKAYRRDLRRAEYGDERDPKMLEHLTKISPANQAHKITSALFVIHGKNDPRVPLSETDQIVAKVGQHGNKPWYMVAENEGHGFRKQANRELFYQLTILFLEEHLNR